jgi:hypothetical protein
MHLAIKIVGPKFLKLKYLINEYTLSRNPRCPSMSAISNNFASCFQIHNVFLNEPHMSICRHDNNKCDIVKASPEVWVAQALSDIGCPLLLNIKKKNIKVKKKKKKIMQNQGYIVFF